MRARVILLIVAILLVAGFAALNWPEFNRTTPLSFGILLMDAPLGMVMLTLLGISLLAFLLASAVDRTSNLVEARRHSKSLEAQRDLADRAEASRFTELRQHMDTQLRELKQRDAVAATEFEQRALGGNRELRTHMDTFHRSLMSRINELENRIDSRFGGAVRGAEVLPATADAGAASDPARREAIRAEREAEQRHEEQLLNEHRLREERLRAESAQQPPVRRL
ncbi:hypothetical protein [Ramlibacter sp.]|uniref:hypothetical protein n=1 Tax=Ramlibacter sp. TaxID=1917967 RepID=UPI001800F959|nr:hypothetical protein [Ramlibacter sp.]MBA2675990.1 hypothetical protein [Ramlibacter sp.]